MTVEFLPLDRIQPNPWQTRRLAEDPDHVADLAADIAEHGLLQVPIGRRVGDRVELAFGHSRYAAYGWLHETFGPAGSNTRSDEFATFPVDVRTLSDRQMAEYAITENAHRKDLSAIEKARAIQQYQRDFGATQAEAGQLFNIHSQGGVSNLLKLLRLPEKAQPLVIDRTLPERLARKLVPLCHAFPSDVLQIAQAIAATDPEDKDETCADLIETLLRKKAQALWQMPFPATWPEAPLSVDMIGGHKSLSELPACDGCEFHIGRHGRDEGYCVRTACFDAKKLAWLWQVAEKQAKVLGLTPGRPGEKVSLIFSGEQDKLDRARRALASKHASLRVVPYTQRDGFSNWYSEHNRRELLGDKNLALASTNPQALYKALPAPPKKAAAKKAPDPRARWKKQEEERKRKKSIFDAMVERVAPTFAAVMPDNPKTIDFMARVLSESIYAIDTKAVLSAQTPAKKRELFARVLIEEAVERYDPDLDETREWITQTAAQLKLKLPRDWDNVAPSSNGAKPAKKK